MLAVMCNGDVYNSSEGAQISFMLKLVPAIMTALPVTVLNLY